MSRLDELHERARKIRQALLKKREESAKAYYLSLMPKVQNLYDWVLKLFETPTEYNTAGEVYLSETYQTYKRPGGYIKIGYSLEDGLTDKPFEADVMKLLVQMFQKTEGFSGKYFEGTFPESSNSVSIYKNAIYEAMVKKSAEEFRQQQLKAAEKLRQKQLEEQEKRKSLQSKAKDLYAWVLKLLETPTEYNTTDEIFLCKEGNTSMENIAIGSHDIKKHTDKPFENDVMQLLADMFQNTEGFSGEYSKGSSVTIKVK